MTPFENNHEDQVAKKRDNKNHLWNELEDNVYVFLEVAGKNQERLTTINTAGINTKLQPSTAHCLVFGKDNKKQTTITIQERSLQLQSLPMKAII